ncbi:MAG TPA: GNAT family protein [Kofleriaceae bacterium]|jgi:RimJ/RimL family protein N-acetyltransferase
MPDELPPAEPRLSDDVLARCASLPKKPAAHVLRDDRVVLEALDLDRDVRALYDVSNGEAFTLGERRLPAYDPEARIWRYMNAGPFGSTDELRAWLVPQMNAEDGRPWVVRHPSGVAVGVLNLIANHPAHLKVELGSIWYGPIAQGTGISRAATLLMLAHVFSLGYRRAEWKCDARNEASRRAALSYGFTFEGVQDAHYIIKGRNRDTAWFRMLDREWTAP